MINVQHLDNGSILSETGQPSEILYGRRLKPMIKIEVMHQEIVERSFP